MRVALAIIVARAVWSAEAQASFAESAFDVLDLKVAGADDKLKGFSESFHDGTWGYCVPDANAAGWGRRFGKDFATVEVLDLSAEDADLKGFSSGFHDGVWGYAIPWSNDAGRHGKVARFSLQDFTTVEVLDLTTKDPDLKGFRVGFQDGVWGYAAGFDNGTKYGKVARFSLLDFTTTEVLDLTQTHPDLKAPRIGFHDGTWAYLVPDTKSKVARVGLADFASVGVLDLAAWDADLREFRSGFQDDTWGYLVPYKYSKVARFRKQTFADVEMLDLAATDPGLTAFGNGFHDGNWAYLMPYGKSSNPGKVVRFRLHDFAGVEVLDLTARGVVDVAFSGGFHDGTWGYGTPANNGNVYWKVVRFELQVTTTTSTTTATNTSSTTSTSSFTSTTSSSSSATTSTSSGTSTSSSATTSTSSGTSTSTSTTTTSVATKALTWVVLRVISEGPPVDIDSEVFDDEASAAARFSEYKSGPNAAAVYSSNGTEVGFHGDRERLQADFLEWIDDNGFFEVRKWVLLRHSGEGQVDSEIFYDEVLAIAKLDEYAGGPNVAALYRTQGTKLSFQGDPAEAETVRVFFSEWIANNDFIEGPPSKTAFNSASDQQSGADEVPEGAGMQDPVNIALLVAGTVIFTVMAAILVTVLVDPRCRRRFQRQSKQEQAWESYLVAVDSPIVLGRQDTVRSSMGLDKE